jgi:quercetin dioxygenase-like cupin family protein
MHRRTVFTTLIALLFLTIGTSVAFAQAPPGPVVRHLFRTAGLAQSARYNLVQNILNFDPGAATPFHRHPGQVLVTVLEGQNTFSVNGAEKIYNAGESFVELPGDLVQARNLGTARMSVMATYLLPWEAPLSRPEPQDTTPLPRPFVSYQFKTDLQPIAEPFDVVQQVLDFAPGAATPVHTHPGILVVTVLAGELTFKLNGADTVYKQGESFVEVPGQVVQARNASTAQTSVMVSYVIPKDAPLSTVHHADPAPAALPTTGGVSDDALPIWLIGLAAAGLIAGGWLVRRRPGCA